MFHVRNNVQYSSLICHCMQWKYGLQSYRSKETWLNTLFRKVWPCNTTCSSVVLMCISNSKQHWGKVNNKNVYNSHKLNNKNFSSQNSWYIYNPVNKLWPAVVTHETYCKIVRKSYEYGWVYCELKIVLSAMYYSIIVSRILHSGTAYIDTVL